ncbi:MAG: hypothetical protein AAFN93_09320, partial [Bacteroidota bacterium]
TKKAAVAAIIGTMAINHILLFNTLNNIGQVHNCPLALRPMKSLNSLTNASSVVRPVDNCALDLYCFGELYTTKKAAVAAIIGTMAINHILLFNTLNKYAKSISDFIYI